MIDEKKLIEERPEWLNPDCVGKEEYNKGWNACNKYWCNTIKSQPKVGEWIPVSERLPDNADEDVLIIANGTYKNITFEDAIMMAVYDKDEGWIIDGYEYWLTAQVTAWQPLPEPYKGESE